MRSGILTVVLCMAGNAWGQLGQPDLCARTQNNGDLKMELRPVDGRTEFREGERIALEMTISASVTGKYTASNRSYDRSGRLEIDSYCVSPQAPDPLELYFNAGAFIVGGLFSDVDPGDKLLAWKADLNEWRRLRPGNYQVYVVSQRAALDRSFARQTEDKRVILRSNAVTVNVTAADRGWQAEQIRQAVAVLESEAKPEEKRDAARVLRFLDTPESAATMARLFGLRDYNAPYHYELMLGLNGSSYRKTVIDALKAETQRSDHPVSTGIVDTLAQLEMADDPQWQAKPDNSYWERWRTKNKALRLEGLRLAADAVPSKTGSARAVTLATLMEDRDADASVKNVLAPQLVANWDSLPATVQESWLSFRWDDIRGPGMTGYLQAMAEIPPGKISDGLRGFALFRLHDLDAEAAESAVLKEFAQPTRPAPMEAVILQLSAANARVAMASVLERMAKGKPWGGDGILLEHYGTKDDFAVVKAAFESNRSTWDCMEQGAILRYFLRVNAVYGEQASMAAFSAHNGRMCPVLQQIRPMPASLQAVAVAELRNPDPELAAAAAKALQKQGDEKAEAALWQRLKELHEQWASREEEMVFSVKRDDPGRKARSLEMALMQAIGAGINWSCGPEKLAALKDLLVVKSHRDEVSGWIKTWNERVSINWTHWPGREEQYNFAQYAQLSQEEMQRKLHHLPSGTRLYWQIYEPVRIAPTVSVELQESRYAAIRQMAADAGVTVERTGP